jgi:hypothetical protein
MKKQTCGPLYKLALDMYAGDDPEKMRLFAAGFVSGQAEKVYLGACQAAMFRPSADRAAMINELVKDACERYGLLMWWMLDQEIWLCRDAGTMATVREMAQRTPNSPGWHRLRAMLCGIPVDEIDEKFHERKGAGKRCD